MKKKNSRPMKLFMLLLQLNITYTCSSDIGYKTANVYVRVIGQLKKIKKTTIRPNERIFYGGWNRYGGG